MPTLRPITNEDLPFLRLLYHSTRAAEMALTQWPDTEIKRFLDNQFEAQHYHYQTHYADASFDIIVLDDAPIGRLYLHRRKDEFRIVDIALMAEYRNLGIGSHYLGIIIAEAVANRLPVRIHVEQNNPAMRLYHRLGFTKIDDNGVYSLLEWSESK